MGSKSENMRSRILYEFNNLIYQYGYKETTLRQLADVCGISRGHLYFYFKKKEELQNALSADLYGKVNLILDGILPRNYGEIERYVILHVLINYVIAVKPELYRISAECAEYIEIMDGKAKLACQFLRRAYQERRYAIDVSTLRPACACAVSGEYAIIRCLYNLRKDLDYIELSREFFNILFRQTGFTKGETYVEQGVKWFCQQNKDDLMQRVYEMDAYNYSYGNEGGT